MNDLERGAEVALSGMTLWSGHANGHYVQCIQAWPIVLYVKPTIWNFSGGEQVQGVALVDSDGKQFAFNGALVAGSASTGGDTHEEDRHV